VIRQTVLVVAAIDRHVTVSCMELGAPSVNNTTSDSDSDKIVTMT